jgi:hypothetical protein
MADEITTPEVPAVPEVPVTDENSSDGEKEKKRGRKKQNKVAYRSKDDPLLNEWPADFDPRKNKPLTEDDFEAQDVFFMKKAEQYRARADQFEKDAKLFKKFGSREKRKAAVKANRLAEQLGALMEELGADNISAEDVNIDVAALLAKLSKE